MNKQEMLEALKNGAKVTHDYFSENEWMKLSGDQFEFEDGAKCSQDMFWFDRNAIGWRNGWSIYGEPNLTKGITTPARDEYLLTLIELTAKFHEAKTNKQEEELLVKIASISYDAVVEKDKRIEELEECLKGFLKTAISASREFDDASDSVEAFSELSKSIDKAKELLNQK